MFSFSNTKNIEIEVNEIIDQIPTYILEKELKDRKEIEKFNPQKFQNHEDRRSPYLNVEINLDEYDLVEQDDINISYFSDDNIINYLERRGYAVYDKSLSWIADSKFVVETINNMPKWKLKQTLCDFLGLSHVASKDDIIHELEEKL